MEQCSIIYIFVACIVAAMLLEAGFFLMNKKTEMKKMRSLAKGMRRSNY